MAASLACAQNLLKPTSFSKSNLCHIFHFLAAQFIASGEIEGKGLPYHSLQEMVNCGTNKIPLPALHDVYFDKCSLGHLFIIPVMTMREITTHKIGSRFEVLVIGDSFETMKWAEMKNCNAYKNAKAEDIKKATQSLTTVLKVLAKQLMLDGDSSPLHLAEANWDLANTQDPLNETVSGLSTNTNVEAGSHNEGSNNNRSNLSGNLDQKRIAMDANKCALQKVRKTLQAVGLVVPMEVPNSDKKVLKLQLQYSTMIADPLALLVKAAMVWSSMTGQKLLPSCFDEDDDDDDDDEDAMRSLELQDQNGGNLSMLDHLFTSREHQLVPPVIYVPQPATR